MGSAEGIDGASMPHEGGLRPGTENVASIVGLGMACELAHAELTSRERALAALRDRLWTSLVRAIPEARRSGDAANCLPNTLSIRFPAVRGTDVLANTPGVAASTGSACHEGHETPSSVLTAMGLGADEALQTVRLSVGHTTRIEEIDAASEALVHGFREAARSRR